MYKTDLHIFLAFWFCNAITCLILLQIHNIPSSFAYQTDNNQAYSHFMLIVFCVLVNLLFSH